MTTSFISRLYVSLGLTVSNGLSGLVGSFSSSSESTTFESSIGDVVRRPTLEDRYTPAALKDRVVSLPGWIEPSSSSGEDEGSGDGDGNDHPSSSSIPFEQFSGYLEVAPTRHIHYWYVESQNDPSTDPVLFWTNGGPGCSGLLGLGTEHGPFYFLRDVVDDDSDVTLSLNPYSWNKVANILYVEQPAGVGFSYVDTKDDLVTGDHQAATDNVELLKEFFRRFPDLQNNPFYISSESYGGHYMPQLTWELLRCHDRGDCSEIPMLSGMMVGNPYVDPFSNIVTQFQSYYAHGLVAKPIWDPVVDKGCLSQDTFDPDVCQELMIRVWQEFGNGINPYALDFPICAQKPVQYVMDDASGLSWSPTTATTQQQRSSMHSGSSQSLALLHRSLSSLRDDPRDRTPVAPPFLPRQDDYKPCEENYFNSWLNRPDVQAALHIVSNSGSPVQWQACSREVKYSSMDSATPQVNLYRQLIQEGIKGNHDLKMLVFSGDDDSICSLGGTQEWIYDLGVEPRTLWIAWTCQATKQTAGFLTHFDLGNDTDATFTLATVHGAGHEVPSYRPVEALELLQRYLDGTL